MTTRASSMANHGMRIARRKWVEFKNSTTRKTVRDLTGLSTVHSVWIASTPDQLLKTILNAQRTVEIGDLILRSPVLTESDNILFKIMF